VVRNKKTRSKAFITSEEKKVAHGLGPGAQRVERLAARMDMSWALGATPDDPAPLPATIPAT
jgi:hypothetical protein